MAFEKNYSSQISSDALVAASFAFDDEAYVRFKVDAPNHYVEGRWNFDVERKSMQFSTVTMMGPQASCIATCLGTAVGAPLLECLLKSRSIADVGKCLDDKMLGAFAGAIVCVGLCLSLT